MTRVTIQTKTHEVVCEGINHKDGRTWRIRARKLGDTETEMIEAGTHDFPGLLLALAVPEAMPGEPMNTMLKILLDKKFSVVKPFEWQQE